MYFIYNVLVILAAGLVRICMPFNKKIKLFFSGRTSVINRLSTLISKTDRVIWFHAASLGEYEQGLPLMEAIKQRNPSHKILLTFFSPSGFEVKKNNKVADVTTYLPLDTKRNAQRFIAAVHPEMVFFIKYEFWPNYLRELQNSKIETYLVSGNFREKQVFFKWYGFFYRKALQAFSYFFVQNEKSLKLLANLGFHQAMVSGDTRFDRVIAIKENDHNLPFLKQFKGDSLLMVAGSTWQKDLQLLIDYINSCSLPVKFVIAPHTINPSEIKTIKNKLNKRVLQYTQQSDDYRSFDVLILDTIGLLTKVYAYANVAYVGGGFGSPGVHNVLEPATFGVPVLSGPNISHFAEVTRLVSLEGMRTVSHGSELKSALDELFTNEQLREKMGTIASNFVAENKGATSKILSVVFKK